MSTSAGSGRTDDLDVALLIYYKKEGRELSLESAQDPLICHDVEYFGRKGYRMYLVDWTLVNPKNLVAERVIDLRNGEFLEAVQLCSLSRLALVRAVGSAERNRGPLAEHFAALADQFSAGVINAPVTMSYALRKDYLALLGDLGVRTIPTIHLPADASLEDVTKAADGAWPGLPPSQVIVKPTTGEAGNSYARLAAADGFDRDPVADVEFFKRKSALIGGWLVQPFQQNIAGQGLACGERSCVFIDGVLLYGVHKTLPGGHGVSRMNYQYGSTKRVLRNAEIPPQDLALCRQLLERWPADRFPLRLARIDVITDNEGLPVVSELEMLNPGLYVDELIAQTPDLVPHVFDMLERTMLKYAAL